ncbi:hypothetical protein BH23PLA1_BH23PLA1_08890 [soil metagenome]
MTCREFEILWNQRLDAVHCAGVKIPVQAEDGQAKAVAIPPSDEVLDTHAASCEACRALAARYQVLLHSIEALDGPPPAPGDFLARFLHEFGNDGMGTAPRLRLDRLGWPLVAVAAAMLLITLGLLWQIDRPEGPRLVQQDILQTPSPATAAGPEVVLARPRPLNETLAEATSLTLGLMWEASEPAARLGRDVLGTSRASERTLLTEVPGERNDSSSEMTSLILVEGPERDVIRSLSEQVGDGVRPLSRPTMNAFAFLMPRLPEGIEAPGALPDEN